jgi:hypothetical protein
MGSSMAVAAIETELRAIPATDLEQVFDVVRDRVLDTEDEMVPPPGVDGLTVLAKVNPACQRRLIEMLEDLPLDGLGPWVVRGWGDGFTDGGARARLDALTQKWATQDIIPTLRVAGAQLRHLPATGSARRH